MQFHDDYNFSFDDTYETAKVKISTTISDATLKAMRLHMNIILWTGLWLFIENKS